MKHLKQEFDKLTFKEMMLHAIGTLTLAASFVLLYLGMLIPPEGEIHDSVLTAFGISLLFVASIYGISAFFVSNLISFKRSILSLLEKNRVDTGDLAQKTDREDAGDAGNNQGNSFQAP